MKTLKKFGTYYATYNGKQAFPFLNGFNKVVET